MPRLAVAWPSALVCQAALARVACAVFPVAMCDHAMERVDITCAFQGGKLSSFSPGPAGEPAEPALVDRGPPPGVPPRVMPCTAVDGAEAATHLEVRHAGSCGGAPALQATAVNMTYSAPPFEAWHGSASAPHRQCVFRCSQHGQFVAVSWSGDFFTSLWLSVSLIAAQNSAFHPVLC